jgi:hypothetical protein
MGRRTTPGSPPPLSYATASQIKFLQYRRSTKRGDSKLTPLVEDMVDAFFMESMKNSTQFSFASLSRQNSLLENGSNGFHNDKNLNGFHAKNESQCSLDRLIFDDLGEALTKHLVDKGSFLLYAFKLFFLLLRRFARAVRISR